MDTYWIVCAIITVVSLTAAYSLGARRKAQNESDEATYS